MSVTRVSQANQIVIDKLKHALATGGEIAVGEEMTALSVEDPVRYMEVLASFFPEQSIQHIEGRIGTAGLEQKDVNQIVAKLRFS